MKTWPLSTFALASAPLFIAYADMQDRPANVGMAPFALQEAPAPPPKRGARPSDEEIRKAVREVLAENPGQAFSGGDPKVLSGGTCKEFGQQFSEAKRPHCMGPDALKHQPHTIETKNWVVGVGGIFALPFWAAAIVRGKCNWTR